jgi:methanogenic corrinoid protein MtbC1
MCMGDISKESMSGGSWEWNPVDAGQEGGKVRPGTGAEADGRMARLVRTIEGEIVPRMVLARRVNVVTAVKLPQGRKPDESDVRELVRLLLVHETGVASSYVDSVRQRGATLESICMDLLAPAARELGLLWEEDECDFMQVTVGLCRLHQVLRELSPAFGAQSCEPEAGRRILLAPCPGEQHTFGVTLVAQFLRRAGWEVWHEFPKTATEILDLTRHNSFAAVGLSVGSETRLDDLAETIRAIRRSSRNRGVGVLVGGPVLVAKPELAASIGADATAPDGRQAVHQAEQIRSGWRRELGVSRI